MTNILNAIEFYDRDYITGAEEPNKLSNKITELENEKPVIDTLDDIRNLVVLCRTHHRLNYTSTHTISLPIWLAIATMPLKSGTLTKEEVILATERVKR